MTIIGETHFTYKEAVLNAENVPLPEIAKAVGTPFYVYSANAISSNYNKFVQALGDMDYSISYAVKANSSIKILKLIYQFGINSFDVASINEVKKVRDLFSDATIFFMNPVKPRHAISMAYFNYGV